MSCHTINDNDNIYTKALNIIIQSDKSFLFNSLSSVPVKPKYFVSDSTADIGFVFFVEEYYEYQTGLKWKDYCEKTTQFKKFIYKLDKTFKSQKLNFKWKAKIADSDFIVFFSNIHDNVLLASLLLVQKNDANTFLQNYNEYRRFTKSFRYIFIFDDSNNLIYSDSKGFYHN